MRIGARSLGFAPFRPGRPETGREALQVGRDRARGGGFHLAKARQQIDTERRDFRAAASLISPTQALAAHVPPLATPLGALLYSAGCGDAFRDWYTPEGGREGGRKLQGFRAIDDAQRQRRGLEMLVELRAFMARSADLDWGLQAQTRPIADAAIEALSTRFE